jgi:cytochrome P450
MRLAPCRPAGSVGIRPPSHRVAWYRPGERAEGGVAESESWAGGAGASRLGWREIPRAGWRESLLQLGRMRRDMLGVVSERFARHGPVVRQSQGPMRMVSLAGPDAARMLLLDREGIFSAKRSWDLIMGRIFPNGLLLRDGEDHRHHRGLLREAFRTPALERYLAAMNPMIEEQLAGLADGDGPLRTFERVKSMTLAIACRIFLGMPAEEDTTEMNRAFEAAVAASMSIVRLPLPGLEFNRGLQGRRSMASRLRRLIADRPDGEDLLARLCRAQGEDGRPLSEDEVVDHMIFLMMAAHDTTTSTLTSLLYELAANPGWQERVRDEVRGFAKPAIGFDDLLAVPQLIAVLQETLRRYPPLSTIPRVSTRSFEWAGCEIPANAMVVIYPVHTHHMPEWWSQPFRFDPERFSAERGEHKRHSHSYFPFGGGNHMCLGLRFAELQIKAVLFQLLQRYRFRVPDGYRMPVQQAPISKPLDGLPLWLEPIT